MTPDTGPSPQPLMPEGQPSQTPPPAPAAPAATVEPIVPPAPAAQPFTPQVIVPEGFSPPPLPPAPAGPTSVASTPAVSPTRRFGKKQLALGVAAVLAVAIVATGVAVAYTYYQQLVATEKFNTMANGLKTQELNGVRNYVKVSAIVNAMAPLASLNNSTNTNQNAAAVLSKDADSVTTIASQSCKAVASDLTAASIDQQAKGLALNATQKRYLGDMKQVETDLSQSEYSDVGICHDGPALAAFIRNFANLLPGLSVLTQIGSGSPTAAQLSALKPFTTPNVVDQATMQPLLPNTVKFLTDTQTLLGDVYRELTAVQAGNLAAALQEDGKITDLATQVTSDGQNMDTELKNLDTKEGTAAIKASQEEIAAIDYQVGRKVVNPNMELDYALPVFRIADAAISEYSDAHNGSYPYGTSVQSLGGLNADLQALQTAGHLKNLSYSSLGSDQSGFSLSATLADGSKLTEELNPSALQSL